jgi:predicted RNase H-like HicB family nuclease
MESEKERMTDLRQLERDTQNIQGMNEHGSYCECVWCLEGSTQPGDTPELAKQEIEQAMTAMLKDLPLPITITKQGNLSGDKYIWQCMGISGKANSFVDAMREALQSLVGVFALIRA